MTKREFNRISNFLDEKGNKQTGSLSTYRDKKTTGLFGVKTWYSFEYIKFEGNMVEVWYKDYKKQKLEMGKFPRKRIKHIRIDYMHGWEDIRGERQKRLSKIL
jgi:hypothetical protein